MPNWCYTNYVIEGDQKQLESFEAKLTELESMQKPLIDNGFGNLWCGIIVNLLGGDWQEVRCRGRILSHELLDGTLRLSVESAWCELSELRLLFHQKFPDMTVYFMSEEPGMEIYTTNDIGGKYFTSRFVVDSEAGEVYFDDILEATAYIQDLIGIRIEEPSFENSEFFKLVYL